MADDIAAARRRRKFQKLFDAAPEFVKRLNAFEEIQAGETVVFECHWKGIPRPTTKWYRDDEEITAEEERVTFEHLENGVEKLTVSKVRKKDEGAYKCKAENQEGVASTTGYLTVKGDYSDKPLSAHPRKTTEHTVSAPPHLRTIVEQKSMEEQEEEEYSSLPPSPLQEFIDAQLILQQRLNPLNLTISQTSPDTTTPTTKTSTESTERNPSPSRSEIELPGKKAPLKAIQIYFYGNTLHSSLKKKKGMRKKKVRFQTDLEKDGYDSGSDTSVDSQDFDRVPCVGDELFIREDTPEPEDAPRSLSAPPELENSTSTPTVKKIHIDVSRNPENDTAPPENWIYTEGTPKLESLSTPVKHKIHAQVPANPESSTTPPQHKIRRKVPQKPESSSTPQENKIQSDVSPTSSTASNIKVKQAPIARQEVESFCLEPSVVESPEFNRLDSHNSSLASLEMEDIAFDFPHTLQVPALDRVYCGRESPCGDDVFLPNGADSHGPEDHFEDDKEFAKLSYKTLQCKVDLVQRNVDLGVGKLNNNRRALNKENEYGQREEIEPTLELTTVQNVQRISPKTSTRPLVTSSTAGNQLVTRKDHVTEVVDQSTSYVPYQVVKKPKPQFGFMATMNYFLELFGEQLGLAADEYGRADLDFPWLFLFALTSVAAFIASATEVSPLTFVLVIMFISVISFRIFFQNMHT